MNGVGFDCNRIRRNLFDTNIGRRSYRIYRGPAESSNHLGKLDSRNLCPPSRKRSCIFRQYTDEEPGSYQDTTVP